MDQAEKIRRETVDKVNELDQNLKYQYSLSEAQENLVYGLFGALMDATRQGENIIPIYFDSKAYTSSNIFQLKDEVENQTIDYTKNSSERLEKLLKRLKKTKIDHGTKKPGIPLPPLPGK